MTTTRHHRVVQQQQQPGETHVVVGKPPTALVYDMSGNVWECPLYGPYAAGRRPTDRGHGLPVLRGSFESPRLACRASRRDNYSRGFRDPGSDFELQDP